MDVPWPNCDSADALKVSLACLEVLYRCDKRAQFHGVLVGSGGPGILVGALRTKGTRPTTLTLTAQSGGLRTRRICRNTSARLLYFEIFVVQTLVAAAASKSLLATRQQTRVARRAFRAES
jgi:hypothetical protein